MKEIRVDIGEVRLYNEKGDMISEFIVDEMNLSDFDIGEIGIALAIYRALTEIDDKSINVTFL